MCIVRKLILCTLRTTELRKKEQINSRNDRLVMIWVGTSNYVIFCLRLAAVSAEYTVPITRHIQKVWPDGLHLNITGSEHSFAQEQPSTGYFRDHRSIVSVSACQSTNVDRNVHDNSFYNQLGIARCDSILGWRKKMDNSVKTSKKAAQICMMKRHPPF